MIGVLSLLLLGFLVGWAAMTLYTAFMLTRPPRRGVAWALARNLPCAPDELPPARRYESWRARLLPGLGEFEVWDIAGEAPRGGGPVVIITHGWGESRVAALSRVGPLCAGASRVIAWDLPGHGDAPGRCALGTREVDALRALIDLVHAHDGAAQGAPGVVLYGSSLGAGVSIACAAGAPPEMQACLRAVIAEAPYRVPPTPARNVLRAAALPWRLNLWPALWLLGFTPGALRRFDRAAHAARLPCPLHVIHGDRDAVCPLQDGRDIAAAAPRAALHVIEGAGHLDLWTDPAHRARCAAIVAGVLGDAARRT